MEFEAGMGGRRREISRTEELLCGFSGDRAANTWVRKGKPRVKSAQSLRPERRGGRQSCESSLGGASSYPARCTVCAAGLDCSLLSSHRQHQWLLCADLGTA